MDLRIVSYVYIDTFGIIEDYFLDKNASKDRIMEAIIDYVAQLEDCEYYLIGATETEEIYREICSLLGKDSQ